MYRYKKSLFIFRRDLRLPDNTGLLEAIKFSQNVIPCFIFDPRQIDRHPFRSMPALHFMLQSLQDLEKQLAGHKGSLSLFYGKAETIVKELIQKHKINAVFLNTDYTPFSRKRDDRLKTLCHSCNIDFHTYHDLLLNAPAQALKKDGTPYTVFTPFFKKISGLKIAEPKKLPRGNFLSRSIGDDPGKIYKILKSDSGPSSPLNAGRTHALTILKNLNSFKNYDIERELPALDVTTHLSPHLKFGTCSIREAYYGIKKELGIQHDLIRQLYWRDFYTHIAWHFPHVFGHPFRKKYDKLKWEDDRKRFRAWRQGKTGFPIVDAGMRQLNQTGFMHNRVRMIAASFLIKDIHIDWQWGERYYATKLIDYDPCVNNGNWQWVASTGCDAQPWFRIFNPWSQQKKFDKDCHYIYQWIPELRKYSAGRIHKLHEGEKITGYPLPIVDHKKETEITKKRYRQI